MKHAAYLAWLVVAIFVLIGTYFISLFRNALAAARKLLSKCKVKGGGK